MTEPRDWKLKPLQVAELPGEIDLAGGKSSWTLGRDPSNDIVLSAPSVSGNHARLEVGSDGDVWIEDLGSRNGTHVSGEAVVRARLDHGDVFQLGRAGPRFALVAAGGLDETVYVPAAADAARDDERGGRDRVGPETMEVVRSAIGLSGVDRLDDLVLAERARVLRRQILLGAALLVIVVGGLVFALYDSGRRTDVLAERQRQQADRFAEIERSADKLEGLLENAEQRDLEIQDVLAAQREFLQKRYDALQARLTEGDATAAEIAELRAKLRDTERRIEGLDPIQIERERLTRVSSVERAVVLIEVELGFRHTATDRTLYAERGDFGTRLNFSGKGEPYARQSSGSGFVVDDDGWIVTNAHVVHKKGEFADGLAGSDEVESVLDLQVVFSNTAQRIPARLHDWDADDDNDLALVRIEPFEGMPHLESFDVDVPVPDLGSPVFVLGFPLGTSALQPDDKVVASTFRGILSRALGDFLQVDAAVHPGNSGGPVIDLDGRVVGVVVGQQRIGDIGASDIGYVIPIGRLGTIWPPREAPR